MATATAEKTQDTQTRLEAAQARTSAVSESYERAEAERQAHRERVVQVEPGPEEETLNKVLAGGGVGWSKGRDDPGVRGGRHSACPQGDRVDRVCVPTSSG